MADGQFDNTNSGVVFRPRHDEQLVASGKLNINGTDYPVKVVMHPLSREGTPEWVLYAKIGVLFTNDKNGNEKAPDRSGPLDLFPNLRVAAWKKEKDGRPYFSLAVSEKQGGGGGNQPPADDGWGSASSHAPQHGQQQSQPPGGYIEDDIPFDPYPWCLT